MNWRRNVVVLVAAVSIIAAVAAVGASAASGPGRPEVLYPVKFGISPPMSSIPPVTPLRSPVNRERVNEFHLFPARAAMPDAVVQRQFGLSNMPAPLTTFDGIGATGYTPPDTEGAVGGNSPASNVYVQWINTSWAVFNKTTGAMIAGPFPGNSFWSGMASNCATDNNGDPIIMYDKQADRWFAAQFSLTGSPAYYQCLAVSTSPDPTGTWYQYAFNTGSVFPDYPKYSIWSDAYLGTYNEFNTESGVGILVMERAKMLVGDPTAAMILFDENGQNWWSVLPADFDGTIAPANGTAIFGQVAQAGTATGQTQDSMLIWNATYDWTNPAAACFGASCTGQPNTIVPVASYTNVCPSTRACIPEPTGGESLDAISGYTMYRLQWRNTGDHENLVANHTVDGGGGVAGVRWYEVHRTSPADWTLYQQGTLAPNDGLYRWMGSIAMDHSGDVAVGYSGSSSATFPGVYYSGRLASDPLGTLPQGEQQLVAGNGVINTGYNRWGDYSAMQIDPTDDCTFWYTQEYAGGGGWTWYTRIGSFKFPSCSIGPTGTLTGTVINSITSNPIPGALVQAGASSTLTDASGVYTMTLPVGTYDMTASKFGFAPESFTGVVVTQDTTTTQDFSLQPVGNADVDGYVTDAGHGWPLYAQIVITATGAPTTTVYTSPFNGYYDVTLVNGYDYTFTVTAMTPGYGGETRPVSVTGTDQTQSFILTPNTPSCSVGGYGPPAPAGSPNHVIGSTKQASHGIVTPPGQQNATSLRGVQVTTPAHSPAAPLAAGDVINSWSAGIVGVWGTDYDQTDGTVWVGSLGALGGDNNDHEYQTNGTSTGRTISDNWAGVFAADMTYDTVNGTLWQLDVGGDNCAHELSPITLTTTGNTICPAFGTSERGLAYDPTTDTFFAGGWNDYMIYRFDRSGNILESFYAGIPIAGLAYNKTTNHLFAIENSGTDAVTVFDVGNSYNVVGSFTIAGFGNYAGAGLEFDCQGHLWAANQTDGKAYEIDSGEAGSCAPPGPCTVISGGLVAGFVKDGNTATGLVGAKVANDLGGNTLTINDPNNGAGYYSLFTPTPPFNGPAMRTFTASMAHYASVSVQEAITQNTVNRLDFTLEAGWLDMAPTWLFDFLNPGQTHDQTLSLTNHGGLDANFQLMVIPQQLYVPSLPRDPAGPIVVPPQGPKHQLLKSLKGIQWNGPAKAPAAPLAAGDVIASWPTVGTNNWGVGYNQIGDKVWAGSVSYFGGDGKDHEYLPDGTATGNTVDTTWMYVPYPADMAFDPLHNTMWQMNVNIGDPQEIDEFDPATLTWTGNKIQIHGLSSYRTGLAYDSTSDTFFMGGWNDATIYRFDRTGTVVQSKNVGLPIAGLAYNPSTGHLFVQENSATDTITVLDVNNNYNVVGSFTVAGFGNYAGAGLEFDCQGHLWALNQGDQKVYEIDSGETGTCPWMGVPWLTLTPTSGVVPAHNELSPLPIGAQFIADGAPRFGQYEAQIMTTSDTPYPTNPVSVCFTKAYTDVPLGSFAEQYIHAVSGAQITQGCGGSMFCPGDAMTRGTMARWMELARHGAGYTVPRCVGIFADVPCETTPNADYIEAFYNEGITAGCGTNPLRYCPNDPVTRAQMAVFIMKSWQGPTYVPPPCTGLFTDVPCPSGFAVDWVEDLYNHGITAGCGTNLFCPDAITTRAQESVFVGKAWNIPMCSAPAQPVKK